jgi:hypothetical protein
MKHRAPTIRVGMTASWPGLLKALNASAKASIREPGF